MKNKDYATFKPKSSAKKKVPEKLVTSPRRSEESYNLENYSQLANSNFDEMNFLKNQTFDYKEPTFNNYDNILLQSNSSIHESSDADLAAERLGFDLDTNNKLIKKELSLTKKALAESQARAISITKELSKSQHGNSLLRIQLQKADAKCQEMIEKHSTDQQKISELSFLNNQMNSELKKVKSEAKESTNQTKEELEFLKKKLIEVENLIDNKNNTLLNFLAKLKMMHYSIQRVVEASNKDLFFKIQNLNQKFEEIMNNIGDIITNQQSSSRIQTVQDDMEALNVMDEMVTNFANENQELKEKYQQLQEIYSKEEYKNKQIIPQYREAINKLRNNIGMMKDKILMLSKEKEEEKRSSNETTRKLLSKIESLELENEKNTTNNHIMRQKLAEYEQMVSEKEIVVKSLMERNIDLELSLKKSEARGSVTSQTPRRGSISHERNTNPENLIHKLSAMTDRYGQALSARHINSDRHIQTPISNIPPSKPMLYRNNSNEDFKLRNSLNNTQNNSKKFSKLDSTGKIKKINFEEDIYLPEENQYEYVNQDGPEENSWLRYLNSDKPNNQSANFANYEEPNKIEEPPSENDTIHELKDEITMLDKEIYQIQKYITTELYNSQTK